jgi:hypothetical protein
MENNNVLNTFKEWLNNEITRVTELKINVEMGSAEWLGLLHDVNTLQEVRRKIMMLETE